MDHPIPPIPVEIISEILSYLGKYYLLKCRLVNQSWNELSLKILRNPQNEHEQKLTQVSILKFIKFFKERHEEWVLPFHLKLRYPYVPDQDEKKGEDSVSYYQISNYIKELQTLFGEKCVTSLTLSHDTYSCFRKDSNALGAVEDLISILTLIDSSLTYLDLSKFRLRYKRDDKMEVKNMLEETELEFPNLSKLMSCPPPTYTNHENRERNYDNGLHSFLIGRSKILINPTDLFVIQTQIGDLKKLKIVEALELENPGSFIFPTLPFLKDLSLTYSARRLDHLILHEFLSSFSTSLQSLTIEFKEIPTNSFPTLIHLRYLRIKVSTPSRVKIHVDPGKLNLNSEAFPVLQSMDISTNVYFDSSDAKSGEDEWILGTVKSLSITVVEVDSPPFNVQKMDQDEDGAIISKASAKNYNLAPGRDLNQLLIAFIQSDGAPQIHELEIQNCRENYMGQILNGLNPDCQPRIIIENMRMDYEILESIKKVFQGFSGGSDLNVDNRMEYTDGVESRVITCKAPSPVRFKMTGLEKFKIRKSYLGVGQEWKQKDLFLMSLPKCLPLLRQIDISQRMFGRDHDFCKQQIIRVQERFPDLIINITH